ncbi:MAG: DUF86 domain-containing protein [Candidatus Sabulitectum sp.]|nr:DUF86 domain-containing protein [Candidatus Sabulitectum sp.]
MVENKQVRNELVFLEDILECIERIADYVKDVSENDFMNNIEKQDSVIRRIELIGEAVKSISIATRKQYPGIPWREIAGMRDIVIHQYFGVSIVLIWRVATTDIPKLKSEFERIVREL